jgi:hypothetical protein
MRKLTEQECRLAITAGEFGPGIIASSLYAAVILTQSWCPQWLWMRHYLQDLATDPDISLFWIEYDKEPFFDDFLEFKEETFGNLQIPYVRYYRNGKIALESNYIDRSGFLRHLKA